MQHNIYGCEVPDELFNAVKNHVSIIDGNEGVKERDILRHIEKITSYLSPKSTRSFLSEVEENEGKKFLAKAIWAREQVLEAKVGIFDINPPYDPITNNQQRKVPIKAEKIKFKDINGRYVAENTKDEAKNAYFSSIFSALHQEAGIEGMALIHRDFHESALELGLDKDTQFKPLSVKFKSAPTGDIQGLVPQNPLLSKDKSLYIKKKKPTITALSYISKHLGTNGTYDLEKVQGLNKFYNDLDKARKKEIDSLNQNDLKNINAVKESGFIGSRHIYSEKKGGYCFMNLETEAIEWNRNENFDADQIGIVKVNGIGIMDVPNENEGRFRYAISDIDLQTSIYAGEGIGKDVKVKPGRGSLSTRTNSLIDLVSSDFGLRRSSSASINLIDRSSSEMTANSIESILERSDSNGEFDTFEVPVRPIAHGEAIHAPTDLLQKGVAASPKNGETFKAFYITDNDEMVVINIKNEEELQIVCAMFGLITSEGCYINP